MKLGDFWRKEGKDEGLVDSLRLARGREAVLTTKRLLITNRSEDIERMEGLETIIVSLVPCSARAVRWLIAMLATCGLAVQMSLLPASLLLIVAVAMVIRWWALSARRDRVKLYVSWSEVSGGSACYRVAVDSTDANEFFGNVKRQRTKFLWEHCSVRFSENTNGDGMVSQE